MIEGAVGPEHGVMALLAGRRESELHVVYRGSRVVVVRLVATHASRVGDVVVVVHVTHDAGHYGVRVIAG